MMMANNNAKRAGQAKKCLRPRSMFPDSDHSAHAPSIIRAFALRLYYSASGQ